MKAFSLIDPILQWTSGEIMWLPSINVNGGYGYKSLHSDEGISPREKNVYNESLDSDTGFSWST